MEYWGWWGVWIFFWIWQYSFWIKIIGKHKTPDVDPRSDAAATALASIVIATAWTLLISAIVHKVVAP